MLSLALTPLKAIEHISILAAPNVVANPISGQAITDCIALMAKACKCEVSLNNSNADVLLYMPKVDSARATMKSSFAKGLDYAYYQYPAHHYSWSSRREGEQIVLRLETPSFEGLSFGLYGLLQEQLWFQFYHPKQSSLPFLEYWPLTENFTWTSRPRFDKKGFHLHTMHPLELTEPLLDADYENGLEEIKAYIDWLVRNQQNYFEFNVLESVDRKKWIPYIKQAVSYAQSRGIIVGVDISLHMTQQKAFMLYRNFPSSVLSKKKQIEKNIAFLAEAGFDVYNVEFSLTEFTPGNLKKKKELQLFLTNLVTKQYGAKLMGRAHVVKKDKMLGGKKQKEYKMSAEEEKLDAERGMLIHTVMFYNIFESKAPVYNNANLRHMLDLYKESIKERETWYFPESAYWITFDNSVPMTLLPYLQARLDDILFMDSLKCKGHITFSSGWEWGYWLVDWSIARWSWAHEFEGEENEVSPLQYLSMLAQNDTWTAAVSEALAVQQYYIKDQELIRYLAPASFPDELPEKFRTMEFQPRPTYSYQYLMNKALPYQLDSIRKDLAPLHAFADTSEAIANKLIESLRFFQEPVQLAIGEELMRGIYVTGLRARHRAYTLEYLLDKSDARMRKLPFEDKKQLLEQAVKARKQAQNLVTVQEGYYRYPLEYIARPFYSHTAYDFGYLYTSSDLHYWRREEEQLRNNKFSPFYMNVMDVARILGIVD